MRLRLHNEQGDTLVEVLVAIAVISLVLVTAYVTTTHNLGVVQDTEEHSQALQLAQAQLEFVHTTPPTKGTTMCYAADGTQVTNLSNCVFDSSGKPTTSQPAYTVHVSSNNPTSGPVTYTVAVTWDSLTQNSIANNVSLYYQR